MKARDATAVTALRSALGAIDNAEAVDPSYAPDPTRGRIAGGVAGLGAGEVRRLDLSEEAITEVVRAEIADRLTTADELDRLGRADAAARLRAEASVLTSHV